MVIKHLYKATLITVVGTALLVSSSLTGASELSIPNEFSSGDTTSAADINNNFSAIETAVNDNSTRLNAIESGSTRVVFQGFSAGTVTGDQGIRQLQSACDATFTGSKICSSEEYANSTYNAGAANLSGDAWLLATPLSSTTKKVREAITGKDYSEGDLSCNGYVSSGSGLIVSAVGELSTTSCSDAIRVACCE